jgi:hypothetical protein
MMTRQQIHPQLIVDLLKSSWRTVTDPELRRLLPSPEEATPALMAEADKRIALHCASEDVDPQQVRRARQYCGVIRKYNGVSNNTNNDRRRACYDKFYAMQRHNRITAKRLNHYLRRPSRMPPLVAEILSEAMLDVDRLLGPYMSQRDWRIFSRAKIFSSGTTQGLATYGKGSKRVRSLKDTSPYGKLSPASIVTTTEACLRTFGNALTMGAARSHLFAMRGKIVPGANGTSVPKDTETDRFIAIEPMLNGMAQQGLRAVLEKRLRRWGITLDDQSRNRELCALASLFGFSPEGYATIDLSSASDTIVTVLVEYLLPRRWFSLLDAARCPVVSIKGGEVPGYSSFSTMGNATTFPLQCLIFASLVRACVRLTGGGDYRVYGDDIILPVSASGILLEVLRFLGFIPNVKKSFITGFFRESCGGDYYNGEDVTPVLLKEDCGLLTTRHVFFNLLQRRDPSHPALDVMFNACKRPLIGPPLAVDNVCEGYFEAPSFYIHSHCKTWYDSDPETGKGTHTYLSKVASLSPIGQNVFRPNSERSYLAALAGQQVTGDSRAKRVHGLRGSFRYHVKSVVVSHTAIVRLERYSMIWHVA